MIVLLSFALLCLLCIILARVDIRDGIIPDWLNLATVSYTHLTLPTIYSV